MLDFSSIIMEVELVARNLFSYVDIKLGKLALLLTLVGVCQICTSIKDFLCNWK